MTKSTKNTWNKTTDFLNPFDNASATSATKTENAAKFEELVFFEQAGEKRDRFAAGLPGAAPTQVVGPPRAGNRPRRNLENVAYYRPLM